MPQVYTICLSGPEKSRARAELALEEARVPLLPTDHHNHHWGTKVPTPADHSVLVVEHPDVDHVVNALGARSKWVLRTHHHAQPAPERPYDPLAELAYRIAALEAQSPRPPIRGGAVESPAWANQSGSYSAEQTRRAMFVDMARTAANNPGIISGGLASSADCQLTAPASGMSTNVNTGELIIPGNEGGSQGGYYARVSSLTNLSIAAANPSNPRIDLLCGTVSDSGYTEPTGGSGNQWAPQVITGTPTSGATLSNLSGVGSLPGSSLLLGYVLVPASATSIITADIANVATPFALQGLGGPTVRGAVNIAASQSTSSSTFTTLSTPDQAAGIVLPTNGLIAVWYQATWQESVAQAAQAAIFLGSNQIEIANAAGGPVAPAVQAAGTSNSSDAAANRVLSSFVGGLADAGRASGGGNGYTGNVTTGQVVGAGAASSSGAFSYFIGSTLVTTTGPGVQGGPCYIEAAAGTYTVSVQFKASSGSVTASNRQLWVLALPFS